MKRYLLTIFTLFLLLSLLAGCARENAELDVGAESSSTPKNMSQTDDSEVSQLSNHTGRDSSGEASNGKSFIGSYEELTAYKTKDYRQKSIADFNSSIAPTRDALGEMLAAQADVATGISIEDENYAFLTGTMQNSLTELYCEAMEEELGYFEMITKETCPSGILMDDGLMVYNFRCEVGYIVNYHIDSPQTLTVGERDDILQAFQEGLQSYLDSLSEEEICGGNIKMLLTDKASELADGLSSEAMRLSCEIKQMDIYDGRS